MPTPVPASWPPGNGEMARRVRDFDWAATSLGALAGWSPALRNTVEILLASAFPMVLRHGPEARTLLYNDAYAGLIGDHHPAAFGRSSRPAFAEVGDRFEPVYLAALAGETTRLDRYQVSIRRGGRLVEAWFEATVLPWRETDGRIAGILTLASEITAQVQAEQSAVCAGVLLQERDDRLQLALDGAGMAIWRWDPQLDVAELDDRGRALLGMPAGEIPSLQTALARYVHPDDREAMAAKFAACLDPDGDGRLENEHRYRRPDGREIWVRLTGYARFVDEGSGRRAVLVMGTLQDVTSWRGAETALRESDARFRVLFDAIDEGFCVIEMIYDEAGHPCDYRFVLANAAFERHTGIAGGVGRRISEFFPDHEQEWYDRYGRIAEDGVPQRFEMRAEAMGRWYDVYAFRVGAPEERRLGVLFTDVSERWHSQAALRASEAQLSKLVEQLAQADRRKNEFLATLAHELRNPLAPLSTAAYMLGMEGGDPDGTLRAMITRQVQHMVRLVDDLLDVSRISRGQVNLQTAPLDLVGVVQSATDSSRAMFETHGHRLELRLPTASVPVIGDETRLAQVVTNLLTNAAKYTPRGGDVVLSVEIAGNDALVCVQDSGIGLPADALETVFEMFAQLPDARGRAQGGLGIGLALARRMAELHGGTLHAESDGPGHGSRFVLRLPLTASSSQRSPGPAAAIATTGTARRVIVVDDNRDAADSLAGLLRLLGHEVRIGYDAPAGLVLAEEFRPHLGLLDIGMPEMDGRSLARAIRCLAGGPSIRLVAVSGWSQPEDREQSRKAGFDDHLAKPIDLATLEKVLATVVGPVDR